MYLRHIKVNNAFFENLYSQFYTFIIFDWSFYSWLRTDLFTRADVQPFHHFSERPFVDHFAHQVGAHSFGVGKAPQQLPGDLQGGQRQTLSALGCAALGFAPSLRHHVIQNRLQCCCWHPWSDPMWPTIRHTIKSNKSTVCRVNTY